MKIILISGKAQHGKDTFASMLRRELETHGERVLIAHYADLVKYVCRTFFDWDGVKDEYGRQLLQYVGTDVVRTKQPDFWADFLSEILSIFADEWDYVIIPDTRFPNEISCMQKLPVEVVHLRIRRSNFTSPLTEEQQQHLSETALDNTEPDRWIENNGTMDDLSVKAAKFVREEFYE